MTFSTLPAEQPDNLPPEFAALSDLVDRARKGEIVLDDPSPATPGRLPSGWYGRTPTAEPAVMRPEWRAAASGLAAGFVVLIPALLFMREAPPAPPRPVAATAATVSAPTQPTPAVTLAATVSQGDVVADIEAAERLVSTGDIAAARAALIKAAAADSPRALFLLAETYDPNLLAARGARGVTADAVQARALYAAAASLGHPLASARIKAMN